MRKWLFVVSCVWSICAVGLNRLAIADEYSEAATRPNILFIIADDASRDSMGVYGSSYVKTPNFDRIAREAVCSPKLITATRNVLRPVPAC